VARHHGCLRHVWRVLPLFVSLLVCAGGATPALHSQETLADQNVQARAVHDVTTASEAAADPAVREAAASETIPASAEPASSEPQDPGPQSQNNPNTAATNQPVTWKNLPIRILGDQKEVWLFPINLAKGQHLLPTLGVVGVTGGLIVADPHILVHVRNTTAFHEFDEIFSGTNTGVVTALIPATFYVYGLVRKNTYSEQTALLAAEAYVDSAIPHIAIKLVGRRLRPSAVPATSNYSDTFFKSHVSVFGKGSSFPSGHAAGIFSIATVIAERYRQHRWVPWVVYGLAGAITFSRVPTFAHFPSDVFLGAALGYTITRFDVLRDRTH
jgi:membrane-associated phospholipid phosphatase